MKIFSTALETPGYELAVSFLFKFVCLFNPNNRGRFDRSLCMVLNISKAFAANRVRIAVDGNIFTLTLKRTRSLVCCVDDDECNKTADAWNVIAYVCVSLDSVVLTGSSYRYAEIKHAHTEYTQQTTTMKIMQTTPFHS